MPSTSVNSNLSVEFFGEVRFWGPYYINDSAILLAAVELNPDAVYVEVGSIQIQPEACEQYIWKLNISESVRK